MTARLLSCALVLVAVQVACASAQFDARRTGTCTVAATVRGSNGEVLPMVSVERLAANGWWAAETITSTTGEIAMPMSCGALAKLRFGGAMHVPEQRKVLPTDDALHIAVRLSPRQDLGTPTDVVVVERRGRRSERKLYPVARESSTADIPPSDAPVRYQVVWSSGARTEGTNPAEPLHSDRMGGFESEVAPKTSRISVRPQAPAGGSAPMAVVNVEPRCSLTAIANDVHARLMKEDDVIANELGVGDFHSDVSYATAVKHLGTRSSESLYRDLRRLARRCPSQRHVAEIASFTTSVGEPSAKRSRLARRILRDVEPTASVWHLFAGAAAGVVRAARVDDDAYFEQVVRSSPNAFAVLRSMLVHADVRGDERSAIAIAQRLDGIPLDRYYGGVFTKYRATRPGAKLPTFAFAGADSKISNDTIAGGPAVLFFWASWCAGCVAQVDEVTPILDAAAAEGVTIVAIPLDLETAPSHAISDRFPESWIKVEPGNGVVERSAKDFDVSVLPVFVLVDANGDVRASSPDVDLRSLPASLEGLQRAR